MDHNTDIFAILTTWQHALATRGFWFIAGFLLCLWIRAARDMFAVAGCPFSPFWTHLKQRLWSATHWAHIGWTHVLFPRWVNECGVEWVLNMNVKIEERPLIIGRCVRTIGHAGLHRDVNGVSFN